MRGHKERGLFRSCLNACLTEERMLSRSEGGNAGAGVTKAG